MDRIIATNSVAQAQADVAPLTGTPGYATDGNPASGVPATQWPAYQYNAIQEELINAITGAGLTANRADNTQLLSAIQKLSKRVWTIISASSTAIASAKYLINNTTHGIVVTLPASPAVGDQIDFASMADTATNTYSINPGTALIESTSGVMTVDRNGGFSLVYSGATNGWIIA